MKLLIIMGAGFLGKKVLNKKRVLYDSVFFMDNDMEKVGGEWQGVEIISIEVVVNMLNQYPESDIIIATDHWKEIYGQCLELNIANRVIQIVSKETYEYINFSYSQDGEDLFLRDYFADKDNGFYIDVGAHHPFRFSNTAWAYEKGWRGINIEPNNIDIFMQVRKHDINLQVGCAGKNGILKYYKYEEAALNCFDPSIYYGSLEPTEICDMEVKTLSQICRENNVETVDLLNVDTEGLEYEILKAHDWNRWKPTVVVIESPEKNVEEVLITEMYNYMSGLGYVLAVRTRVNSIYVLNKN